MSKISPSDFPQGIISKGHKEKDFHFSILSGNALALIQYQLASMPPSQRRSAERALFYFEHLLWLTNHPPIESVLDLQTSAFLSIQRLFYGAIQSHCYLASDIKLSGRHRLALYFFKLLALVSQSSPVQVFAHSNLTDAQTRECVTQFESTLIDPERVARLSGWHVENRNGDSIRLKMESIFDTLGPRFTKGLHQESRNHAMTHSHYGNYANVVSRFDNFVRWYAEDSVERQPLSPEVLQDPSFVYQFFGRFQRWHFEGYLERSQTQPTNRVLANLQRQWIRILCWAKLVLIRSRLMCSPLGDAWPEGSKKLSRTLQEVGHHRYADGEALISQKLLTQVPLSVTDEEATELLFKRIEADFNKVVLWARRQIDFTARRLSAIDKACGQGDLITQGNRISSQAYGQPVMAMNSLIRTVKETHNGFTIIDSAMRERLVTATGFSYSTANLAERLTKLFVALIEQHEYENGDDFRRALLDGETLKRKVQEYTGHTSISSLEPYIHLAFEEAAKFGTTLDLIKAKLAVESLQSNLKDVVLELSQGRSPTELSILLGDYINLALEELSSASISTER